MHIGVYIPTQTPIRQQIPIITCAHQEGALHGSEKTARAVIVAYLEEQICEILEGGYSAEPMRYVYIYIYIYIYAHVLVV